MDYLDLKCPVCEKEFCQGEDVVVCPECGTPHHRECYEINNKCFYEDKHGDGFSYEDIKTEDNSSEDGSTEENKNTVVCKNCNTVNPAEMFFCGKCGHPLTTENPFVQNNQQNVNGIPFDPFDPMGGIPADTDMGDNVTAGEIAKYVQNNTPYFLRVFKMMKDKLKGKFSFVGFIFGGGYLLYRKMYKLGTILTLITAFFVIGDLVVSLTPEYQQLAVSLKELSKVSGSIYSAEYMNQCREFFYSLDSNSIFILIFSYLSLGVQLAIQIIVGVKANKWYFNDCKKKISKIKAENPEDITTVLESKGGVNKALAMSLLVVQIIIIYLPGLI